MKKLSLLGIFLMFSFALSVSAQVVNWAQDFQPYYATPLKLDEQGNTYVSFGGASFISTPAEFKGPNGPIFIAIPDNQTLLAKLNAAGQLIWHWLLPINSGAMKKLEFDNEKNVYLLVNVLDQFDADPGPDVNLLMSNFGPSTQHTSTAVIKLDPEMNFVWHRQIIRPSSYCDSRGSFLLYDSLHNEFVLTFRESQTAFCNDSIFWSHGNGQFAGIGGVGRLISQQMLRFSPDGSLAQPVSHLSTLRYFDNSHNDYHSASIDNQGNVYFTGSLWYETDFAPGLDTVWSVRSNGTIFAQKIDAQGKLAWLRQLKGQSSEEYSEVIANHQGDIIWVGRNTVPLQANFASGVVNIPGPPPPSGEALFILILSGADGEIKFSNSIPDWPTYFGTGLGVDDADNIFIASRVWPRQTNYTPGSSAEIVSFPVNNYTGFVWKLSPTGEHVQLSTFTGPSNTPKLLMNGKGEYVMVSGVNNPHDYKINNIVHPLPNNFVGTRLMITKVSPTNPHSGQVYFDENENGMRDSLEKGMYNAQLITSDMSEVGRTNRTGEFVLYQEITGDTVRVVSPYPQLSILPEFLVADSANSELVFRAIDGPVQDIGISAVELTPFRPGFDNTVIVRVTNWGPLTATAIPVKLTLVNPINPGLAYISALPLPDSAVGRKIYWQIDSLDGYQTALFTVNLNLSFSIPIGSNAALSAELPWQNDWDNSNNTSRVQSTVVGSYDPNDKHVTPDLVDFGAYDTTLLKYVVRFQNTGTYHASIVTIRDTLPSDLDITTLRVDNSSHACTWRLIGSNILECRFDPIFLPQSMADEPNSHGFVSFVAKMDKGLPWGTAIANQAGIYFDYNSPIITNYAVLNFTSGTISGPSLPSLEVRAYPNPAADYCTVEVLGENTGEIYYLEIQDALGCTKQVLKTSQQSVTVPLRDLPEGVYTIKIRDSKRVGAVLLVKVGE